MGYVFVSLCNLGDYLPTMGVEQEQPLGTKKLPTSSRSVPTMHFRRQGNKKRNFHGGANSLPVPTCGPVDGFWKSHRTADDAISVYFLCEDRINQPQGKCGQDDAYVRPCGTPIPIHQPTQKGVGFLKIRRAENCRCDDGIKRDQPFGTKRHF